MADPEKPPTPPPGGDPYYGDTIRTPPPPASAIYGDTIKHVRTDSSPSSPPTSATNPPTAGVTPPSAIQTHGAPGRTRGGTEADVTPPEVRLAMADASRWLNQYVLVLQVGQGGMGSVWKAWDTKLTRWVAVKFLNATHEESIRRFQREAQLAARLRHPNIAAIYEVNEFKGVHFLVMDFIDGTSIGKAGLDLEKTVEAMAKVCDAIDYAHRHNIIHRDLKPQNIMVTRDGEPFVTDFGLAKVLATESSISVSGAILGTPAYMPPEQASGDTQSIDARSDIYSLGATLYMLVAGRPPFEAENATALLCKVCTTEPVPPRKHNPQCPAALEAIILKAMAKNRDLRYATAGAMAEDLRRHLQKLPVTARRPGAGRAMRKAVAAVLAMLLAGGAVVAGLRFLPRFRGGRGGETPGPAPTSWADRFGAFQRRLAFDGFRPLSGEELRECREILTAMPEEKAGEVAAWMEKQASDRIPAAVWPTPLWSEKQEEARKITGWCRAVQGALQGLTMAVAGRFRGLQDRLEQALKDFDPVVRYVESDVERRWRGRFDDLILKLVFDTFRELPPETIRELNAVMREMPEAKGEEAAAWFDRQIARYIPAQVWPKPLWGDKKAEAARIVAWCGAAGAILEGADDRHFKVVRERLARAAKDFEPVARFVEAGGEREWRKRFDDLRLALVFESFRDLAPETLRDLNGVMKSCPPALAGEAAAWFERQVSANVPAQVWPRPLWGDKKAEAARIVAWCGAAGAVLEGTDEKAFRPVRERLAAAVKTFDPVARYVEAEGPEKAWVARFDGVCEKMVLASFRAPTEADLAGMRRVMAEVPESLVETAGRWFSSQADHLPAQVWPKALWLEKQEEARRIAEWCRAAGALLGAVPAGVAPRLEGARKKVEAAAARFAPVAAYRGRITLRIYVLPFASLKALQVGDRFLVRDGRKAEADLGRVEDDLSTPLVVEGLDIGDLAVVLALPGKGDHVVRIPAGDLKDGQEWLLAGPAGDPALIRPRKMR